MDGFAERTGRGSILGGGATRSVAVAVGGRTRCDLLDETDVSLPVRDRAGGGRGMEEVRGELDRRLLGCEIDPLRDDPGLDRADEDATDSLFDVDAAEGVVAIFGDGFGRGGNAVRERDEADVVSDRTFENADEEPLDDDEMIDDMGDEMTARCCWDWY